jgi:hypothetical protein
MKVDASFHSLLPDSHQAYLPLKLVLAVPLAPVLPNHINKISAGFQFLGSSSVPSFYLVFRATTMIFI